MHLQASKQTKVQVMMVYLPLLSKKCPMNESMSESMPESMSDCISLATAVFPDKLRIARVIQIFKESKTLVTNYRPISVLSCFSKLLEYISIIVFINFLQKKTFFTKSNSGFKMHIQQSMLFSNT